jgi:hypothetical protein
MALKTTDTTAFNLDLNQLVEESFERCGAELRSGYDLRTARRSLNLLTIEWANRGTNLWTIEQGEQVLTYNVADYDIPVDTIDLLDHVIRTGTGTNQTDINISRISMPTYAMIPNKNATGRPIQVWFQTQDRGDRRLQRRQYPRFTSGRLPTTPRPTPSSTGGCGVCRTLATASMGKTSPSGSFRAWWRGWPTTCP